ncbi:hypothetical protein [Brachyspira hyodysenteriae]|uniref:hypothetical protein n=1 Tax=Brachyspira hyodysenteriae TaxID=159 RepID=UPI00063DAE5F|nr:hypothetical protein [Brachyspira hyodysenteriae]KLI46765.1 hypothetical protein SZ42_12350 [Brachyspira hyodysenteriae]
MKICYTKYAIQNKEELIKDPYLSLVLNRLEKAIKEDPTIKKSRKSPLKIDDDNSIDLYYRSCPSNYPNVMYVYFIVIQDEINIISVINDIENPDDNEQLNLF